MMLCLAATLLGTVADILPELSDGSRESLERAFSLNTCSLCEAVAYQAASTFLQHRSEKQRGLRNGEDAADAVERLCTPTPQDWTRAYGLTSGVGLLVGPGILATRRQGGVKDPQLVEGVSMRLHGACSELLSGGDDDESQLYHIAVTGADAGRKHALSSGAVALASHMCDREETAPCRRYALQYGGEHLRPRDPKEVHHANDRHRDEL